MIKFLCDNDKQLIFNYLDISCSALLSAITEIYPNSYVPDGVFAMQFDGDSAVSLLANGESFSLLFSSEKSDLEELRFALRGSVHSPAALPFKKTGEYFLLKKETEPKSFVNQGNTELFSEVLSMNGKEETVALQYLFKKGTLVPFVLPEIGGGFAVNSSEYSVISHVFVNENSRGKGYGTGIVKNLLSVCESKNVYLLCEENNLIFYGKLGFKPVLTVYKYDI